MDGADDPRVFWIDLDALAKLRNVLVERAAVGEIVLTPAVIEDRVAIQHLALAVVQELKNFHVAQAQFDLHVAAEPAQLRRKDFQIAEQE